MAVLGAISAILPGCAGDAASELGGAGGGSQSSPSSARGPTHAVGELARERQLPSAAADARALWGRSEADDRSFMALLRAHFGLPPAGAAATVGRAPDLSVLPAMRIDRPRIADEPVVVESAGPPGAPTMRIAYRLQGASAVQASEVDGVLLYRRAVDGGAPSGPSPSDAPGRPAHLLRTIGPTSVEDFVWYPTPPAQSELRYSLSVVAGVAGLRLVSRVLEAIDAEGAPRLRMPAPWLVDRSGKRVAVDVRVAGCEVDRDPRGPWGRAPQAPGAAECTVLLHWDGEAVDYPALLDPGWESTVLTMTSARGYHTLSPLPGCRLLAAGGLPAAQSDPLATAEIFDAGTQTWSPTGEMSPTQLPDDGTTGRYRHAATMLVDGRVLVSGGFGSLGATAPLRTVEAYDPAAGHWSSMANDATGRADHSLTTLEDGQVLAFGGTNFHDAYASLFDLGAGDPGSWAFEEIEQPPYGSERHTATLASGGRVLIVGGRLPDVGAGPGEPLPSALLYDPTPGGGELPWADVSPPFELTETARMDHTATLLPDGSVLVAGGFGPSGPQRAAHLFVLAASDGAEEAQWLTAPPMSYPRAEHSASLLDTSQIVVIGGGTQAVEVFYLAYDTWAVLDPTTPPEVASTGGHRASALPSGRSAIATGPANRTAAWRVGATGACCGRWECASGYCVDGVCCDTACAARCHACTSALKGQGEDGQCGPVAAGNDPEEECEPDDAYPESCGADGTCDGTGQCRAYAEQGTVCLARSCPNDVATIGRCDGTGVCEMGQEICFPYRCSQGRCGIECSSAEPCANGAYCYDGQCRASTALGDSCTTDVECAEGACAEGICCASASCSPYRCGPTGQCPPRCLSSGDCLEGWRCGSNGQCVAEPPRAAATGGCGCRVGTRARPPTMPMAVALAIGAAFRSSRRRGRPREVPP